MHGLEARAFFAAFKKLVTQVAAAQRMMIDIVNERAKEDKTLKAQVAEETLAPAPRPVCVEAPWETFDWTQRHTGSTPASHYPNLEASGGALSIGSPHFGSPVEMGWGATVAV